MKRLVDSGSRLFCTLFIGLFWATHARADAGVTYHGRLLKPDGEPVTSTAVHFRIQIRTPIPTNCLMYEETQVKDLSGSRGVFSLVLNDGSATDPNGGPFTLDRVFQNRGIFSFGVGECATGNTFEPGPFDGRILSVSFNDGDFGGWEPLPPQTISFVPTALEAVSVGGYRGSQLFKVDDGTLSTPEIDPWTSADYQKLLNLVAHTTVSGGVVSVTGTAAGFTGTLSGDVTGGQSSTKVGGLQGRAVLDASPSNGQVLTWNHALSRWEPATLPAAGNPHWDDIVDRPSSLPPSGAASGDLTGTYPDPTIADSSVFGTKIANGGVAFSKLAAGLATGQVLRWDAGGGGSWSSAKLKFTDLVNAYDLSPWPGACAAGEAIVWESASDSFSCRLVSLNALLPVQTGEAGKVLQTDGTNVSWAPAATGGAGSIDGLSDGSTSGGSQVVFLGPHAGESSTSADNSTALGYAALANNPTGRRNTALGARSLVDAKGDDNIALGYEAGSGSNGDARNRNVFVGNFAGADVAGADDNVMLGHNAGSTLTSGARNIVIGSGAALPSGTSNDHLNIGGTLYGDLATDRVKIGGAATLTAGAGLEIATTGSDGSSLLVPRDTTGNRPAVGVDGMIRYNSSDNKFEFHQAGGWVNLGSGGVSDHGALGGLGDDDHAQYALLAGRAGGQSLVGGTAANNNLRLESTSAGTKGHVLLQPNGGSVGVGTNNPLAKLHVKGGGFFGDSTNYYSGADIAIQSATDPWFTLDSDHDGQLAFGQKGGSAQIATDAEMLEFKTGHIWDIHPADEGTTRMVIKTDTGNVGIGTTNPQSLLHVAGTLRANEICDENGDHCKDISDGWGAGTETDPKVGANAPNYLSKWNGSALVKSELFESGGNLGLGTATPAYSLDIRRSAGEASLSLLGPDSEQQYVQLGNALDRRWAMVTDGVGRLFFYHDYTGGSGTQGNTLVMDNSDQVGINTINPETTLHVSSSSKDTRVRVQADHTRTAMLDLLSGTGVLWSLATQSDYEGNALLLLADGNTRMTVTPSGSVGIGTSSPSEKLEVAGKIKGTELCIGTECRASWPSATIADGSVTGAKLEDIVGLVTGTYGSSSAVPRITVDSKGRITSVTSQALSALPAASGVGGKFLKSDGTDWSGQNILFSDVKNSLGGSAFDLTTCGANKTVSWSALLDTFSCQAIDQLGADKITSGTLDAARLPTSVTDGLWSAGGGNVSRGSGKVGIGTTSPYFKLDIHETDADVHVAIVNDSSTTARFPGPFVQNFSGGHGGGPSFTGFASRGTSSSPQPVAAGDTLLMFNGLGQSDTSSGYGTGALIHMNAAQTFSPTGFGTNISFATVKNDETSLDTRMIITHEGRVGVGTTNPQASLDVAGEVKVGTTAASCGGSMEGALRYNSSQKAMEFCNGLSWQPVNSLGFVGGLTMRGAASCLWSTNSTSWVRHVAGNTNCLNATVEGTATTPAEGKIPGLRFPSLAAGRYKVTFTVQMVDNTANALGCYFRISDGSTASVPIMVEAKASWQEYTLMGDFNYTADQGPTTYYIESRRDTGPGGGSCEVMVDATDFDLRVIVEKIK